MQLGNRDVVRAERLARRGRDGEASVHDGRAGVSIHPREPQRRLTTTARYDDVAAVSSVDPSEIRARANATTW